ncbi:type II toxin-antitoxin system MqsA family antitoxin [Lachnospiraceae bacterium MD329]|nr:type II toxin-antitoxin system MqsA family antitoxin [Lachnospiraceae bacterium MD329]
MRCIECGHDLIKKEKTYVANLDNCVIVIKNVPALVCEHCKEVYYTDDVFEKIETTVNKLKNIINDVAIIDYNKQAA